MPEGLRRPRPAASAETTAAGSGAWPSKAFRQASLPNSGTGSGSAPVDAIFGRAGTGATVDGVGPIVDEADEPPPPLGATVEDELPPGKSSKAEPLGSGTFFMTTPEETSFSAGGTFKGGPVWRNGGGAWAFNVGDGGGPEARRSGGGTCAGSRGGGGALTFLMLPWASRIVSPRGSDRPVEDEPPPGLYMPPVEDELPPGGNPPDDDDAAEATTDDVIGGGPMPEAFAGGLNFIEV